MAGTEAAALSHPVQPMTTTKTRRAQATSPPTDRLTVSPYWSRSQFHYREGSGFAFVNHLQMLKVGSIQTQRVHCYIHLYCVVHSIECILGSYLHFGVFVSLFTFIKLLTPSIFKVHKVKVLIMQNFFLLANLKINCDVLQLAKVGVVPTTLNLQCSLQ